MDDAPTPSAVEILPQPLIDQWVTQPLGLPLADATKLDLDSLYGAINSLITAQALLHEALVKLTANDLPAANGLFTDAKGNLVLSNNYLVQLVRGRIERSMPGDHAEP